MKRVNDTIGKNNDDIINAVIAYCFLDNNDHHLAVVINNPPNKWYVET